jgi:hypothetical protein
LSATDPEDVLIAEGFPQLDPKTSAVTVSVTTITSKKVQATKRERKASRTRWARNDGCAKAQRWDIERRSTGGHTSPARRAMGFP